jgi:acetolactate synthase I/II/III large subunit
MATYTTAQYFLEGLLEVGVEYLFANLGTDHASLIEAYARLKRDKRPHPKVIVCPHENVAVHMAGGYAAVTGRGQAVLVHVDVGTANAGNGMHNLCRARLPVMLIAGRAPYTVRGELPGSRDNYVHFVQDPYDIGSIVRPYAKWEYTLYSGLVSKEVLRRGHALMQSDPPGPVFLTLPRETLAATWEDTAVRSFPEARYGPVSAGGTDPATARKIATHLMAAENPVAITSYLGRKPEAVGILDALARECGMRVFESHPFRLNIPHDSPCFAGFEPGPAIAEADVGLLADVDVPWLPKFAKENPRTRWLQVDVDAIKAGFPLWGFPTEVRVQGDCATVLGQVLEIVRAEGNAAFRSAVAGRMKKMEAQRQQRQQTLAAAAARPGERDAITPDFLCAALNKVIGPEDIVVNEAIRNATAVLSHIPRTRPQTMMGVGGSGLGFSGGMALGVKLARPDRRVVQIVGDGSYHFCTPDSVYAVAQRYKLPIFTVVLDNGGWQAVKGSVLRVHPEGAAAETDEFLARLEGEQRRFEQVAESFGAFGATVSEPGELDGAIKRCLAAVDAGQAAVLTVRITPL